MQCLHARIHADLELTAVDAPAFLLVEERFFNAIEIGDFDGVHLRRIASLNNPTKTCGAVRPVRGTEVEFTRRDAAITWLNAYRGKSLDLVDLYDADASMHLEGGQAIVGQVAIEIYWSEHLVRRSAYTLVDLQVPASQIVAISYLTSEGLSRDVLEFGENGKIVRHVLCTR